MSRVLGRAPAHASPAEQAAAKEQRRRGRFRAAKRLARFNAWLFGPKLVDGKWVKGDRIGTGGRKLVGRGDDAPKYPGLKRLADGDGRVTWTGIETCGSVWACLACAAKIRAARAEEIDFLAKAHIAAGGSCTFVTFTLPHIASDDLETLWRAVQRAWRKMVSGSSYQAIKARYGMLGTIRAVEATLGKRNGWHPHLHVLFFHDAALHGNDGTLEEFRDALGARWGRYIEAELGRQVHELYGVDAVPVRDEAGIGAYVSKIHYELARSDLKIGRDDGRSRSLGRSASTPPKRVTPTTPDVGGSGPRSPRAHEHSACRQPCERGTAGTRRSTCPIGNWRAPSRMVSSRSSLTMTSTTNSIGIATRCWPRLR